VAITDGELLSQIVIERNVGLIVEADSLIVSGSLHAIVDLFGGVVDANKAVHEALAKSVAGIKVICFLVSGEPRVIEVWDDAAAGLMEGEDLGTVIVEVGIETVERAGGVQLAGETIDARMIFGGASVCSGWRMVGSEWGVWECAEIIVEGMVFLRDDDDVIDFFEAGLGERGVWGGGGCADK
jgi:hypothetical protein